MPEITINNYIPKDIDDTYAAILNTYQNGDALAGTYTRVDTISNLNPAPQVPIDHTTPVVDLAQPTEETQTLEVEPTPQIEEAPPIEESPEVEQSPQPDPTQKEDLGVPPDPSAPVEPIKLDIPTGLLDDAILEEELKKVNAQKESSPDKSPTSFLPPLNLPERKPEPEVFRPMESTDHLRTTISIKPE